jgi:hypothetical protein
MFLVNSIHKIDSPCLLELCIATKVEVVVVATSLMISLSKFFYTCLISNNLKFSYAKRLQQGLWLSEIL